MCGLGIVVNWELRIINKLMRYSNFFAHSQVSCNPTSLLEFIYFLILNTVLSRLQSMANLIVDQPKIPGS